LQDHRFALILPTLNAEKYLPAFLAGLRKQEQQPDRFLVVDSSSDDHTAEILRAAGAEVIVIDRKDFDHGLTRNFAAQQVAGDCEIAVFATQDVVLVGSGSLAALVDVFTDESVLSAFGRQLPRPNAGTIEAYGRGFSYPAASYRRTIADAGTYGFKACFSSNAFGAYRIGPLLAVSGFPKTILSEDALAVARLFKLGGVHAYVAEATVLHSHGYTLGEEFRRYFDIGAMHSLNAQLLSQYDSFGGTGRAFVMRELKYLLRHKPWLVPEAVLRTLIKYVAYKAGRNEAKLSPALKRRISMHKRFWTTD